MEGGLWAFSFGGGGQRVLLWTSLDLPSTGRACLCLRILGDTRLQRDFAGIVFHTSRSCTV